MRKFLEKILILFLLSGCVKESNIIKKKTVDPEIIIEELLMVRSPKIFCTKKNILLSSYDYFPNEKFIKLYNQDGELLSEEVNIGNGPNEFITPKCILYKDNSYLIWDQNKTNYSFIYTINEEGEFIKQRIETPFFKSGNPVSAQSEENGNLIIYNPENENVLSIYGPDGSILFSGGKLPFPNTIKDKSDAYQGELIYNRYNKKLLLFLKKLPYAAIYKVSDTGITLLCEKILAKNEYTITDNIIHIDKPGKDCMVSCCLIEDYIVSIKNDPDYKGDDHSLTSPKRHTVALYDYELNLKEFINIQMVRFNLAAVGDDNTFYAAVQNPENSIVKVTLEQ